MTPSLTDRPHSEPLVVCLPGLQAIQPSSHINSRDTSHRHLSCHSGAHNRKHDCVLLAADSLWILPNQAGRTRPFQGMKLGCQQVYPCANLVRRTIALPGLVVLLQCPPCWSDCSSLTMLFLDAFGIYEGIMLLPASCQSSILVHSLCLQQFL